MKIKLSVILLLSLSISTARAFETLPQFHHLDLDDAKTIYEPRFVDSEYSSDVLTFDKNENWHWLWLKSPRYFDTSIGSLSSKRFLIQNRLKLTQTLTERLDFQLYHLREGDFGQNQSHFIFAFPYRISHHWQISIFGEAQSYKSQDDIGLSTTYLWSPQTQLQFYFMAPHFSLNERNEANDRFVKSPQKWGLQYLKWTDSSYWDFHTYWEKPTEWTFPTETQTLKYEKKFVQLLWSQSYSNSQVSIKSSHAYTDKTLYTANSPSGGQTTLTDFKFHWQSHQQRWGYYFAERVWDFANGEVHHMDSLPFYWHKVLQKTCGH